MWSYVLRQVADKLKDVWNLSIVYGAFEDILNEVPKCKTKDLCLLKREGAW